jgi:hypothetical protein
VNVTPSGADGRTNLDFDEGPNQRLRANLAPVDIDQVGKQDANARAQHCRGMHGQSSISNPVESVMDKV